MNERRPAPALAAVPIASRSVPSALLGWRWATGRPCGCWSCSSRSTSPSSRSIYGRGRGPSCRAHRERGRGLAPALLHRQRPRSSRDLQPAQGPAGGGACCTRPGPARGSRSISAGPSSLPWLSWTTRFASTSRREKFWPASCWQDLRRSTASSSASFWLPASMRFCSAPCSCLRMPPPSAGTPGPRRSFSSCSPSLSSSPSSSTPCTVCLLAVRPELRASMVFQALFNVLEEGGELLSLSLALAVVIAIRAATEAPAPCRGDRRPPRLRSRALSFPTQPEGLKTTKAGRSPPSRFLRRARASRSSAAR